MLWLNGDQEFLTFWTNRYQSINIIDRCNFGEFDCQQVIKLDYTDETCFLTQNVSFLTCDSVLLNDLNDFQLLSQANKFMQFLTEGIVFISLQDEAFSKKMVVVINGVVSLAMSLGIEIHLQWSFGPTSFLDSWSL